MKIYKTKRGIVLSHNNKNCLLENIKWGDFINDDALHQKAMQTWETLLASTEDLLRKPLAPIGKKQELWACGVTYLRSKIGREEESKVAGGADFYSKVYEAERPEVFFKANPWRVADPGKKLNIRKDSTWDVPEPELTLFASSSGKIVGYTIGNDMSSRSIEGENPLYLPQAKTYDDCASLGPCLYVPETPLSMDTLIDMKIERKAAVVFSGSVALNQMKRSPQELVSFVFRACSFPEGCFIMTGTGIVPGSDFTLHSGDEISITIEPIGTLVNTIR